MEINPSILASSHVPLTSIYLVDIHMSCFTTTLLHLVLLMLIDTAILYNQACSNADSKGQSMSQVSGTVKAPNSIAAASRDILIVSYFYSFLRLRLTPHVIIHMKQYNTVMLFRQVLVLNILRRSSTVIGFLSSNQSPPRTATHTHAHSTHSLG